VIRCMLSEPAEGRLDTGSRELIDRWQADERTLLWLDMDNEPAAAAAVLLHEEFGLHPLAVQDALRERHPPKLEDFGDYTFLLLRGLSADSRDTDFSTIQLALFVGRRFLVTRHSAESPSTDRLWREVQENPDRLSAGPAALALRLCRIMVDRYLGILLALEPRLEELEDEILSSPRDELLGELAGYKSRLKKLRRVVAYHQQVFSELRNGASRLFGAEVVHELNDVYEHQERAVSLSGLYYELAVDLVESYLSLASHHLNRIMKVLTIVTAIFVPLSFLAGLYGMNFENIPELHARSGYFILLGVMAGIVVLLLALFRKMRWL
jgi:magnesium transporter